MFDHGTPTAYAYFGISGEFNPDEFSAGIGLAPAECLPKHSKDVGRGIPKDSILHYAKVETSSPVIDIYQLTERMVDILEPHRDRFASMIADNKATACLQIVLNFPSSDEVATPVFGISNRVASFVAFTGASIDIDCYRFA
jgi:hypothetical protein